jgi:hypothetical protein
MKQVLGTTRRDQRVLEIFAAADLETRSFIFLEADLDLGPPQSRTGSAEVPPPIVSRLLSNPNTGSSGFSICHVSTKPSALLLVILPFQALRPTAMSELVLVCDQPRFLASFNDRFTRLRASLGL